MSTPNILTPDLVIEGVNPAYAAEGLTDEDGGRDTTKLREALYEVLKEHKVLSWADRTDHAITKGNLIAQVFPNLPGPDAFGDQEDPDLARAIWAKIRTDVWSQLATGAKGSVQQLVGRNMGNGYVLVRCQLTPDNSDAVYITDDRTCIERDYLAIDNKRLARMIASLSDNRAMLITRQPDNAKRYASGFDKQMKALGNTAHDKLMLAIEAAVFDETGDSNGDGED